MAIGTAKSVHLLKMPSSRKRALPIYENVSSRSGLFSTFTDEQVLCLKIEEKQGPTGETAAFFLFFEIPLFFWYFSVFGVHARS